MPGRRQRKSIFDKYEGRLKVMDVHAGSAVFWPLLHRHGWPHASVFSVTGSDTLGNNIGIKKNM